MRGAEKNGKNGHTRSDFMQILELAEHLHGNQARAKAIFACSSRHFWREFDLPAQLPETRIFVNRRFHLQPLASLLGAQPHLCVALVDRHRARFFDLRLDELQERESLFHALPRRGRSDGYAGYDGGHSERRVKDEVLHHFKQVSEHLREALEKGIFENVIIGCHETNWHELESYLHPHVAKQLLGRFPADVGSMTEEQVREHAARILRESIDRRCHELVQKAVGFAKGNSRGVTGLRRVLRSLEIGEVQTLLIGEHYSAHAVECAGCGHLDSHLVRYCPACGRATRELDDVCDAIIPIAICRDIELFYVKDAELDKVGNIAALLRFRSDQGKGQPIAAAS
jgi:peptide subunit release factor 1 (eRF1)